MSAEFCDRLATPADQDPIWRVRTAAIRGLCNSHYSDEQINAWANVTAPDNFAEVIRQRDFLVAQSGGSIVGFGFLNWQRAEIEAVFIAPAFARQGTGAALLTALEQIARQAGLERLTLSSSLNAAAFYKAAGYRATDEATWHHPAGFSLACVAMSKELRASHVPVALSPIS